MLKSIGFKQGDASPCVFYHNERGIRLVVRGDDFTGLGLKEDNEWLAKKMSGKFEIKGWGMLGWEEGDDKSIRILNRVLTCTEEGIEYEADQRHAEIITSQMGLGRSDKSVGSPVENREDKEAARDCLSATIILGVA